MESATRPGPRDQLLLVVVIGVTLYALGLVLFGLTLGDQIFDQLGFGPDDGEIVGEVPRQYVQLL